ncbi:uncharacterized protein METZ01_LOCUS18967 [marine metagenome]|uniref:Uncharacterized protein n=1 Tax=marine metagenome TaxID=408172 RepID=A0A381PL00_9ZZZZ
MVFPSSVKAKQQTACADLSSNWDKACTMPSKPMPAKNHFTSGPGNSFQASKYKDVSSTITGA